MDNGALKIAEKKIVESHSQRKTSEYNRRDQAPVSLEYTQAEPPMPFTPMK